MFSKFGPYCDFRVTSAEVLKYLHQRLGFSLWMVTRAEGDDWIVLQAEDHGYGIKEGDVLRWTDSICVQMVNEHGPCIAPRVNEVPAYAASPIVSDLSIAAYIGLPLLRPDGTLFGTICAIDPLPQSDDLLQHQPLLELTCRMLSTILGWELRAEAEMRRAEYAEERAETDSLTGVFNRRGWDRLLAAEESRCRRYGNHGSVFSIDLDDLKQINDTHGHATGDAVLIEIAQVLCNSVRDCDVVARVGGDEFAILAVNCDQTTADDIVDRLDESLSKENLRASIGVAGRETCKNLAEAWAKADRNMYHRKRAAQNHDLPGMSPAIGRARRRKSGGSTPAV